MRRSGEKLRLGAFFNPTGHHVASWRHPDVPGGRRDQFRSLRRDCAHRRARQDGPGVPCRQHLGSRGASRGARPLGAVHRQHGADHAPVGARRGDEPDRPGRHRVDQLQRALSRGAQVRLDRSHQQRARRLEPGHFGAGRRRLQFLARRALRARRYATNGRASSPRSWSGCGTAGTTMRSSATRRAASFSIPPRCIRSITRASGSRCADRSTSRVPRKDGRSSCRRADRRT